MHCPNCALKIEAIEDLLPGVKQVSASYRKGQVLVEFDESQVDDAAIIAALRGAGYTAEAV